MFYTVYQITNLINGKIYIGKHQTKNLNDDYMGSGKNLKKAIIKYGITNFSKDILFIYNNEDSMNIKEAELVTKEFCLREDTYNICIGGKGGFSYINGSNLNKFKGKKHTEDSKKRMGHIGNNYFLGKSHSQETKEKIGQKSKDRRVGKSHNLETKKKISKTLKEKQSHKIDDIIKIIIFSKENKLSVRKTCQIFNLNRITYTKYIKELKDTIERQ